MGTINASVVPAQSTVSEDDDIPAIKIKDTSRFYRAINSTITIVSTGEPGLDPFDFFTGQSVPVRITTMEVFSYDEFGNLVLEPKITIQVRIDPFGLGAHIATINISGTYEKDPFKDFFTFVEKGSSNRLEIPTTAVNFVYDVFRSEGDPLPLKKDYYLLDQDLIEYVRKKYIIKFSTIHRRNYILKFSGGISPVLGLNTAGGEYLASGETLEDRDKNYQIVVVDVPVDPEPDLSAYAPGEVIPSNLFTVDTSSRIISVVGGGGMTANITATVLADYSINVTQRIYNDFDAVTRYIEKYYDKTFIFTGIESIVAGDIAPPQEAPISQQNP